MKTLPKLWRRKRDGKEFGAWHVNIRNKPINLCTDIVETARERRIEAVRKGLRKWPRRFAPKAAQQVSDTPEGTGVQHLAALGDVAPDETTNVTGTNGPGPTAAQSSTAAGAAPPSEVIEPEPIPQLPREEPGAWAADLGSATPTIDGTPEAPPRLRLTDFAWFKGALVTASKAAVGLQLHAQAYVMRLVGDIEAGRVGPPPREAPADGAAGVAELFALASTPWDANDPREPGRIAYEQTIVALIPAELPVPAWLKWFEAPVVTAMNTAPIQWQTGKPIKRDASGEIVPPDEQQEAPTGERAAA